MSTNYKLLTTREMRSKGYTLAPTRHEGEPSKCNKCGAEIEWWITTNGKSVPYDPATRDDEQRTCHFATCPQSNFTSPSQQQPQQAKPAQATGYYPQPTIEALRQIKQQIVDEYRFEHEGDAAYQLPEHKCNWLYKKLAETRLELSRRKS